MFGKVISSKALPLALSALLRLIIAFLISRVFPADLAAPIFLGLAVIPALYVLNRGRLAAAKTRCLNGLISVENFDHVHFSVTVLFVGAFILVLSGTPVWAKLFTLDAQTLFLGLTLGVLYFFQNTNLMANEARKRVKTYYWIVVLQLTLTACVFSILDSRPSAASVVILAFVVIDLLLNLKTGQKLNKASLKNEKFSRIELTTTLVAAVELPLVHFLGDATLTVHYALFTRIYVSIVTVYGQVSRFIWSSGEKISAYVAGKKREINVNLLFLYAFSSLAFGTLFFDIFIFSAEPQILWSLPFFGMTLAQLINRFFKNKFLHEAKYEDVGVRVLRYYLFYAAALCAAAILSLDVASILFLKLALALAILTENLKENHRAL